MFLIGINKKTRCSTYVLFKYDAYCGKGSHPRDMTYLHYMALSHNARLPFKTKVNLRHLRAQGAVFTATTAWEYKGRPVIDESLSPPCLLNSWQYEF